MKLETRVEGYPGFVIASLRIGGVGTRDAIPASMQLNDTDMTLDDAADTLRFRHSDFDSEAPTHPDATSIYDLRSPPPRYEDRSAARRRRKLRDTRVNVQRLREALANGWDIAPELEYEEQRLVALEAACGARHDAIGY